jgi:hypothetical protein
VRARRAEAERAELALILKLYDDGADVQAIAVGLGVQAPTVYERIRSARGKAHRREGKWER